MDKKVRVQKYLGSVDLAHTQCMHVVVGAKILQKKVVAASG